jgi:hypothetical protein
MFAPFLQYLSQPLPGTEGTHLGGRQRNSQKSRRFLHAEVCNGHQEQDLSVGLPQSGEGAQHPRPFRRADHRLLRIRASVATAERVL